jgi:hypothetical protein
MNHGFDLERQDFSRWLLRVTAHLAGWHAFKAIVIARQLKHEGWRRANPRRATQRQKGCAGRRFRLACRPKLDILAVLHDFQV